MRLAAAEKRAVVTVNRRWTDAIGKQKSKALDRMLADEFTMVLPNGATRTKEDYLRFASSFKGDVEAEAEVRQIHGDVAIVVGKSEFTDAGKNGRKRRFVYSNIFVRSKNEWIGLHSQVALGS